jgi:hypothetical protein
VTRFLSHRRVRYSSEVVEARFYLRATARQQRRVHPRAAGELIHRSERSTAAVGPRGILREPDAQEAVRLGVARGKRFQRLRPLQQISRLFEHPGA